MTTPGVQALARTDLSPSELGHLHRLLGSWSVLADLSFSDLLLVVAARPEEGTEPQLVVIGQIRPSNRPTLVDQDLVGQAVLQSSWSLSTAALVRGEVVRGTIHHPMIGESVPVENVPVRFGGRVIGVVVRMSSPQPPSGGRGTSSGFEKAYLEVFDRLTAMVAESAFPFPEEDVGTEETPRVGDGFVVVDAEGRVEFASPNAVNAFHRMGVYSPPEGARFTELGIEESAVEWALATGRPVVEEVERRPDVIVLVHCIPLLAAGAVTGAVILLRDVTDVRRLDRLLLSKDAAIREVHHRVKNNLQTISSLLSLQARRAGPGPGQDALREAERRVRSIALVHEILSREPGDQVAFGEIVRSLVQMAQDSVVSSCPVRIEVAGDLGDVAADVATPLAVILAELLQNAVEHAFVPAAGNGTSVGSGSTGSTGNGSTGNGSTGSGPSAGSGGQAEPSRSGTVRLALESRGDRLLATVRDDGIGLPPDFDIEMTTSLGLSIVRDLVLSQLEGSIRMGPADGGGTEVVIDVPAGAAPR